MKKLQIIFSSLVFAGSLIISTFAQAEKTHERSESPRWRIEHSQNITPIDQNSSLN